MKGRSIFFTAAICLLTSCGGEPDRKAETDAVPATATVEELGKQLFFDKRLSSTGQMSCETCHVPELGWTDAKALSPRFDGSMNTRHTPTLINVLHYKEWYWDGRAATLEGQITAAWRSQMGAANPDEIAAKINEVPAYRDSFTRLMGGPATGESIPRALAAFVRTIKSENAPWDKYEQGDKSAVSEEAIAGFKIFSDSDKANCTLCHLPPLYTDTLYHNVGVGYDKPSPDPGRGKILSDRVAQGGPADPDAQKLVGAFKTPTMRSVTETKPYFHDGSAATLEDAVDYMLRGGTANPNLDEKLKPRKITPEERTQLLAFMRSLTPPATPYERPRIP